MTPRKKSTAPANLGTAGRALWDDLTGTLDFELAERAILATACQQADALAALEAAVAADGLIVPGSTGQPRVNPAVGEARQARLALARLLGYLAIPGDEDDAAPMTASARRAQRAARIRWGHAAQPGTA